MFLKIFFISSALAATYLEVSCYKKTIPIIFPNCVLYCKCVEERKRLYQTEENISNTRIPEDDSSAERKSSLDLRAVSQNFVVLTSLTPITSVKSGNFGHQVNSDSDHVCFK